jgi:hypothetical protein
MEYHVTPVDDLVDHEENEDCVCGPDAELVPGSVVYVHHSLDNREASK